MTSKSVLIEPEETQFQNEMLFKERLTNVVLILTKFNLNKKKFTKIGKPFYQEISKVMTRKKSIKEEEENPLKPVTESTYFKLPFKFDTFPYLF